MLSQYLTAVNSAGVFPPQEEGLFSNSWNGKFHLEMHAWHAAHFAVWGRPELLERSMPLVPRPSGRSEGAREGATACGGAWWPKMVGPEGRESPSKVNPFIMWQQPHPIYLAEVLYNARKPTARRSRSTATLVFETAELLATWPYFDRKARALRARAADDPGAGELRAARHLQPDVRARVLALRRSRPRSSGACGSGCRKDPKWDNVLFRLSKLPQKDGLYLAAESQQDLWERARSPECSNGKTAPECPNRDHPSFVAALGLLPGWGADRETMRRTLERRAEGLGPAPDLGLGLADAGDDGDAAR